MNTSISILNQKITPKIVPWIGMQADECILLEPQPADIGWNCHMFTLGLSKTDFSEIEWKKLFYRGANTFKVFGLLYERSCISGLAPEMLNDSNAVFYLGKSRIKNNCDVIKFPFYIIHSAIKQESHFFSRMSFNNTPEQIFIHDLSAVQGEYKYDENNLHILFGHITSDKELIKETLRTGLNYQL